jgi:hypothetical protein
MSTKHSAIEAAARDSYEQGDQYYGAWDSLDPILREYAIKNAGITIRAYLSAIAEDEASVEAVARAMCIENMNDPDDILTSNNVRRWQLWTPEAKAGVQALLERAKEQQG